MKNIYSLVHESEDAEIVKSCEFSAVRYDINNLAKKIQAAKNAKINILNLKKIINSLSF